MDTDIPFKPGYNIILCTTRFYHLCYVRLFVYYSDTLNVLHCDETVAECIFLRKRDGEWIQSLLKWANHYFFFQPCIVMSSLSSTGRGLKARKSLFLRSVMKN